MALRSRIELKFRSRNVAFLKGGENLEYPEKNVPEQGEDKLQTPTYGVAFGIRTLATLKKVEPRCNEPLYDKVLAIMNDILQPDQSYSKIYGIPRYNEHNQEAQT